MHILHSSSSGDWVVVNLRHDSDRAHGLHCTRMFCALTAGQQTWLGVRGGSCYLQTTRTCCMTALAGDTNYTTTACCLLFAFRCLLFAFWL